jgi:hypothetical protein
MPKLIHANLGNTMRFSIIAVVAVLEVLVVFTATFTLEPLELTIYPPSPSFLCHSGCRRRADCLVLRVQCSGSGRSAPGEGTL